MLETLAVPGTEPTAATHLSKSYAAMDVATPLQPFEIERRDTGPHDVMADIMYCGVCHSDLHFVRNDWGMSIYPLVPGHEIVGRVKKVGSLVSKFKVGDLVGIGCLVNSCRTCDNCKEGEEQYCTNGWVGTYSGMDKDGTVTYGGYSNQIVCNEDFVLKIQDTMPLERVAPLLCAGITTYSPMRHWNVKAGQRVGVVGLGGLGHMAVKFGVSFGAEVTVFSTSANKHADATALGAHRFVVSTNEEQLTANAGCYDFIINTVAATHDYNIYLALLRTSGVMVCVGIPPEPAHIPAFNLVFQRKSLAGSLIGGIAQTQEMLDYCATNNIAADVEVISMQDINEAYERMERSDVKYRFVIDMATI